MLNHAACYTHVFGVSNSAGDKVVKAEMKLISLRDYNSECEVSRWVCPMFTYCRIKYTVSKHNRVDITAN
jgi:hypothetical protein